MSSKRIYLMARNYDAACTHAHEMGLERGWKYLYSIHALAGLENYIVILCESCQWSPLLEGRTLPEVIQEIEIRRGEVIRQHQVMTLEHLIKSLLSVASQPTKPPKPEKKKILASSMEVMQVFKRVKQGADGYYVRIKPVGFLLNSKLINEQINRNRIHVLNFKLGTNYFIDGDEEVVPINCEIELYE